MNKYLTEKLEKDELVYAISVGDVQQLAKEKTGRKLDYSEMYTVKKGIEWGFFDWDEIVNVAIGEATEQ